MHIFARDRQGRRVAQYGATQRRQARGIIGPQVEGRRPLLPRKAVHPHGKDDQLARAARRFEQAARVRVEARWRGAVDLADMSGIAMIMRPEIRAILDIGFAERAAVQPPQHLLGIIAQRDAQMIDQAQASPRLHHRMQAELREGGPALDQRSAAIVADAPHHRRAETG